jgi:hypothetical protein
LAPDLKYMYIMNIHISVMNPRIRTYSQIIGYGLYRYFLGLSFRNAAKYENSVH